MRNMKKLLQKAMVFALTAAMLVGTPLTASAAPLNSVYSIQKPGMGIDQDKEINTSGTGTVTNTETGSGILNDNDAKIIGLVLDKENVDAEKGVSQTLTATIALDGKISGTDKDGNALESEEALRKLSEKITWRLGRLDENGKFVQDTTLSKKLGIKIADGTVDRRTLTLVPKEGTRQGEEVYVQASINSSYYITKSDDGQIEVKAYEGQRDTYEALAKVFIKEYSTKLAFSQDTPVTALVKHTLDLNDYLVREPMTANDTITWSSSDTKTATVSATGIVTFKKTTATEKVVTITAVSEKGVKATHDFTVEAGTPASKIEIGIYDDDENFKKLTKLSALDLKDNDSAEVIVKKYATVKSIKMNSDGEPAQNRGKYVYETKKNVPEGTEYYVLEGESVVSKTVEVTDDIAWTSNKTTIATVMGDNDSAIITAAGKAIGNAVITAKASGGKSAKVTVPVKATLSTLTIGGAPTDTLYSGQTAQLTAVKDPAANKDAVKWSVAKVEYEKNNGQTATKANPNATINAKGLLTIKPKLDPNYLTVTVVLETTKAKNEDGEKFHDEVEITIGQSSIDGFTILDDQGMELAKFVKTRQTIKNRTTNISVPKGRTYTATVEAVEGQDYVASADTLVWKSSSAKVATVEPNGDGTAKITAIAKGTATITVSGVRAENKPDGTLKSAKAIKATFKVSVKQPTTSLTMNKTSVVLKAANNKNLSASFSVKQNKNANEKITWAVKTESDATANITSKGKVTITKNTYKAGDKFEVTATSESGVTAKATIKIVTASAGVQIYQPDEDATFSYYAVKKNGAKGNLVKNATTLDLGDSVTLRPMVNVGGSKANAQIWIDAGESSEEKVAADVTYTVNKKGIVQIIGNTVYRIGNGSVTITAKTADGKSYRLKIDDASKAYVEPTED